MVVVARRIFGRYDIHEQSGYPRSVPIPNQEAAAQIVQDALSHGKFLDFVALLLEIDKKGLTGRKYRIPRLRDILLEVMEMGFSLDEESGRFVENTVQRKTKNWGVLREKEIYMLAFLRLDVVAGSLLVRENSEEAVSSAYRTVREIVQRAVHARNGRLWSWEGDGGTAAFYTDEICAGAVHSAVEALHELLLYNSVANPLSRQLSLRMAVHSGKSEYRSDYDEVRSDVIKRVMELESKFTEPNRITISDTVYRSIDPRISAYFTPLAGNGDTPLFTYAVEFDS